MSETVTNNAIPEEMNGVLIANGVSEEQLSEQLEKQTKKAEKVLKNKEQTKKVLNKAKWLFEMLQNIPFVGRIFETCVTLCDLVRDHVDGLYDKVPLATVVTVLGGLLYFLSPADLIPDALPLIGAIDDAAVLYIVTMAARKDVDAYLQWKATSDTKTQ